MVTDNDDAAAPRFFNLARAEPWRRQIVTSAVVGILLLAVGGAILYLTFTHLDEEPLSDSWVAVAVGGAFTLVGLLMAANAVHQAIASMVPEPELAVDSLPLRPGQTVRLRVRQPGPVQLHSLSARLVCEVMTRRERQDRESAESRYDCSYPFQEAIPVCGMASAGIGEHIETIVSFVVPTGAEATRKDDRRKVQWRIELWGRVRRWPDFVHPYPVHVSRDS